MFKLARNSKPQDAIALAGHAFTVQTMAERIRALREAQGMTQVALAKQLGITSAAISQWETGLVANIKLATFLRLCEVLHTDPHFLIYGADRGRASRARGPGSAST